MGWLPDAVREAWRARVPETVGAQPGSGRLLLPVWPYAVLGALMLFNVVGTLGVGVWSWIGGVPALAARWRPLAAAVGCVVVNLIVIVAVVLLEGAPRFPSWGFASGFLQLLTAYTVALALTPWSAAATNTVLAVTGAAALQASQALVDWFAVPLWLAAVALAGLLGARRAAGHAAILRSLADDERRRVIDERARIARELHDVVAHHMSAMAVRAASAPHRIEGLTGPARDEFAALAAGAREALGEMRQLLGVLRGVDGPALAPQPGLADLPAVVERTRQSGTPVVLDVDPATVAAPATAVSVYRIVQEALSNVTRHATGAATTVRVATDGVLLVVEVRNAAPAHPLRPGLGGHGLAGMRERVRLLGGRLHVGPTADGGFVVRAGLPAEPAP